MTARTPSPERIALRDQAAAEYRAGDSIRGLMARHHMSYGAMRSLLIQARVQLRPRGGARVSPRAGR
jgi:hypothetical protein